MESSWYVKKSNGFNNQNNNVHVQYTSSYMSLPSLFDYDVKIPDVKFYREYDQVKDEILFPFLNLNMVLRNSTPGEIAYIWQSKWDEIIAIKIEGTRIPFSREVFAAPAAATATEWNGSGLQDFRKTGTRALSSVLAAAWALFWTFQYPEGSDNYQKNVWYLSVQQIIKQFKLPIPFLILYITYEFTQIP